MEELDSTQQRLRGMLYRFDCPSPLTLGEYVLDLLAPASRMLVARHTLGCSLCTEELSETRAFLAGELVAPASGLWRELRRVVATLFTPSAQPRYSMARGEASSSAAEYRAGPITIVIGEVRGKHRGVVSIDGLILHAVAPPGVLGGREVTLSDAAQAQVQVARTDELGSFAFEDVIPGTYRLEVTLEDEVVVVEDVHVGS
ncbi:MAG: hypothetical protein M3069_13315 [Chloroflexota bacterium]|nr:hypothetical protein [Chloroflexota bacterium]